MYTYVYNNPVNLTDPTGHDPNMNATSEGGGIPSFGLGLSTGHDPGQAISDGISDTINWTGDQLNYLCDNAVYSLTCEEFLQASAINLPMLRAEEVIGNAVVGLRLALSGASKVAQVGDQIGNFGTLVDSPGVQVDWGIAKKHALNRMAAKEVSQAMVDDWVANGAAIQQDANTYLFLTREGVAVVDKTGKLITAYSKAYFKDSVITAIQQVFGK